MNKAFYTAGSGVRAFQTDMDIISNNVANINTVGFKNSRASFKELLVTEMDNNEAKQKNHTEGHGCYVADAQVIMQQGQLETTEYSFDFAIVGDGFFSVERGGEKEYTRNGAFKIGTAGSKNYLTAGDGAYVLDKGGKRVELKNDSNGLPDVSNLKEMVGVFAFKAPEGLKPMGNTSFRETDISGKPQAVDLKKSGTKLMQGVLERADVNLADQMAEVITAQRAYSLNAKILQTADQIEEMSNNLR